MESRLRFDGQLGTPVVPAAWRPRQEEHRFEASLGHLARPCLNVKNKMDWGWAQRESAPDWVQTPVPEKGQGRQRPGRCRWGQWGGED